MSEFYPHRSALYMPGSNERALEKAKSLPADLFIFDMEDAVSPETVSYTHLTLPTICSV